jgi:hypothetical protein
MRIQVPHWELVLNQNSTVSAKLRLFEQRMISATTYLKNDKNSYRFWSEFKSCMNFCHLLIYYSRYHSLFKNYKLSWIDQVLVELSVYDPCGYIIVRPVLMPLSQKPWIVFAEPYLSNPLTKCNNFIFKKPYGTNNKYTKFQLNRLNSGWNIQNNKTVQHFYCSTVRLKNRVVFAEPYLSNPLIKFNSFSVKKP